MDQHAEMNEKCVYNNREHNPPECEIKIIRIRHSFEFLTPYTLKVTEETTLYNSSEKDERTITITLKNYCSNLRFYDFDGTPLEFHSDQKQEASDFPADIEIIFPSGKPIPKNEYRTFIKENYLTVTDTKFEGLYVNALLRKGTSIYVYIKECKSYEFNIKYSIMDQNGGKVEKSNLIVTKEKHFFELYSNATYNNNEKVNISVDHKIPSSVLNWYTLGLFFGFTLPLLTLLLYFFDKTNLIDYITVISIPFSLLLIIKGWMTQYEVTTQLSKYDIFYRAIIFFILIIVLFMFVDYSYNYTTIKGNLTSLKILEFVTP